MHWFWRAWDAVVGPSGWRSVVGPFAFALVGIALLVYNHLNQRVTDVVFWLTLGLILTVLVRMLETNRRQARALAQQRRDALNDRVTGLRNRASLEADIAAAATAPGEGWVLVLLELDGFESHTDQRGYAAAEETLRGFARQLVDAVAPLGGIAYRIEANRLAVLVPTGDRRLGEIVLTATGSLRSEDADVPAGRCYGEVAIPEEATDAEGAFQIAGRRLAAQRQRQHRSARRQAHAVLMAALAGRDPELRDDLRLAAYRSISLARRLGLGGTEIDDVALAAELQSIGLLAVPGGTAAEQALEGEKIVAAAPGLAPVATLVRSSAERFDGTGVPDELAGDEIPLGSRIIAVAVTFAAMTSPGPDRAARNAEEALAELRHRGGNQLDPRIVEALAGDLTEEVDQGTYRSTSSSAFSMPRSASSLPF